MSVKDCAVRQDWEVFVEGKLSDGTNTMWIRNIKDSNKYYLIEECVNGSFNVLNQDEKLLSNHKTLHSAKISVGKRIDKKELIEIARNVNGKEFESILTLCKKMYPKRKRLCYSLREDETGETRYVVKWNLTKQEYKTLRKAWESSKDKCL